MISALRPGNCTVCGEAFVKDNLTWEKYVHECNGKAGGGIKHDQGKPRYELIPARGLAQVVDVIEFGAKKYAPNNWRKVTPRMRYVGAIGRHFFAWLGGERFDKETGLSHLAHIGCCVLFLLEYEEEVWAEKEKDNG